MEPSCTPARAPELVSMPLSSCGQSSAVHRCVQAPKPSQIAEWAQLLPSRPPPVGTRVQHCDTSRRVCGPPMIPEQQLTSVSAGQWGVEPPWGIEPQTSSLPSLAGCGGRCGGSVAKGDYRLVKQPVEAYPWTDRPHPSQVRDERPRPSLLPACCSSAALAQLPGRREIRRRGHRCGRGRAWSVEWGAQAAWWPSVRGPSATRRACRSPRPGRRR